MGTTTRIIEKINELKNENYTPLKLQLNKNTYIKILEECGFIKKENDDYYWDKPGLVKINKKDDYPNQFYGIPFIIDEDGFDWAIISEEKE